MSMLRTNCGQSYHGEWLLSTLKLSLVMMTAFAKSRNVAEWYCTVDHSHNSTSSSTPFASPNTRLPSSIKMVRVSVLVSFRAFRIRDEPPIHYLERLPCEFAERVTLCGFRWHCRTTSSTQSAVANAKFSSDLHPKLSSNSSVSCKDMACSLVYT